MKDDILGVGAVQGNVPRLGHIVDLRRYGVSALGQHDVEQRTGMVESKNRIAASVCDHNRDVRSEIVV